jgi:hypothetical protein
VMGTTDLGCSLLSRHGRGKEMNDEDAACRE